MEFIELEKKEEGSEVSIMEFIEKGIDEQLNSEIIIR